MPDNYGWHCDRDTLCRSLVSLPSLAYLATACVVVLLTGAVVAYCTFREAEWNRRLFVLPLVLVAPAILVNILDWTEVARLNTLAGYGSGPAYAFPLPWLIWSDGTSSDYVLRTWLLLLGTLGVTGLILFKAWIHHLADHSA